MYYQDDIEMQPVWRVQVDNRPGAAGGYENPTSVKPHTELENLDSLTAEEIATLEDPIQRNRNTKAYQQATVRRDEILRQIRKRHMKG